MGGLLVIVFIIVLICNVSKEKASDARTRAHAESIGLLYYASSDGLRDVKTNKPYHK